MDFALPELLNREDIIKIFKQRQLHVPNLHELTLDELLRIYKTFAMPLSRRPDRSKKLKQLTHCKPPATTNKHNEECNMQIEYSDSSNNGMDIDFYSTETNSCEQPITTGRMSSPAGEKRRQRCSDEDTCDMLKNDYQYQLSSVTKRIRINSVS